MSSDASSPISTALFIEDDADIRAAAGLLLQRHGWRMLGAGNPGEAWVALAGQTVDVVLLDLNFARGATSGEEGLRCLHDLIAHDPNAVVVVVTGHSGINVAVAAMRAGAADFVMKPWSNERLMATLNDALALRRRRLQADAPMTEDAPMAGAADDPFLGESAGIERMRRLVERAAPTAAPVLIHGGPGAGKDLIARALHRQSGRPGALLKIEVAAQGHGSAAPLDHAPAGATVLLDEIGAADLSVQDSLLAALMRRGDLRLISATRMAPAELAARLRQDLLYRLNTIEVEIPPLTSRPGDVLLLARHFLGVFAQRHGLPARPLLESAAEALVRAPWPGGVRELRTRMERAVLLAEGTSFEAKDFDFQPQAEFAAPLAPARLAESERALVEAALKRHNFNVSRAAADLGLTRAALYRRMAKHGF